MSKVVKSDLTVVGAGYAGICAAIAAARHGVRVALINDRNVLGGNASSEHRVHVNGGAVGNNTFYGREAGIADELKMFTMHKNPNYKRKLEYHLADMALLEKVLDEKNISLHLGTSVYDCECHDGKIERVFAFNPKTQEDIIFESELFCDASGDGILAYKSGCEFRMGRESRDEFGEDLAPENADDAAMPSCILFTVAHTGKSVKFKKPSFAYDLVKDGKFEYFNQPETGRRMPVKADEYNGIWWLEFAYPLNTVTNADEIDFELKKLVYGYWDYIKNSGEYPDADDMILDWVAPYASKRESRRFIGEYILKQSDIQNSAEFEDAVSTGGWSLDLHDTYGIYGHSKTSAFGKVDSLYNIPLSIMYSKDMNNLFWGGRIASCTHVAMGSTRVMQTLGAMGHAVGTAAALCKKYGCEPAKVRHSYIAELQELLQKDGQYILGKKEDCGLAANAKITASSVKKMQNTNSDKEFLLNDTLIFTLPVSQSFTGKIEVKIKNNSVNETVLKYKVHNEKSVKTDCPGEMLAECEMSVFGGFDGYITLPVAVEGSYKRLYVTVEPNDDISVFGTTHRVTGAPSAFGRIYNAKFEDSYSYCFKGVENNADLYRAENVVNGYSRCFCGVNCWISEGKDNEWLELEFEKPVDITNVQIYFNPQYETDEFYNKIPQLVTDYDIEITGAHGITKKRVRDNCCGRNSFDITVSGVRKIRFDFIGNNGAPEFEVFAVKVF